MATPTYDLLDSTTLGTATASVTFSGISGDYRDLVLVFNGETTLYDSIQYLEFNADTTSGNYFWVRMNGTGSAAQSSTDGGSTGSRSWFSASGSENLVIWQFMDYSATDKHKSWLVRENVATEPSVSARAGRWASTSAINEIKLTANSDTFVSGSSVYLYGIEA